MSAQPYDLHPEVLERIRNRSAFAQPIQQLTGYWTQGGTYVIASAGYATDSGDPRDLVAILPGDLGQGRVVPLYIGTNPAVVAYLETELARHDCERAAAEAGWVGPDPGNHSTCQHTGCNHPASQWVENMAMCACDHRAEMPDAAAVALTEEQRTAVQAALGDAYAYRVGDASSLVDADVDPVDKAAAEHYAALAEQLGLEIH
jgi:hypothetical protein